MIHDIMKADKAVGSSIKLEKIPGAVMQIGHGGSIDFVKSYGHAEIIPKRRLMTENTLFDLASLTKVTAVWPGIIRLLAERKIKLDTAMNRLLDISSLPAGIGGITIHQLLTHTAGFVPFMDTAGTTREERIRSLLTQPLMYEPGTQCVYSDLGFICLGEIIAGYSGLPLQEASKQIFLSLGMRDTGYLPDKALSFASTEVVSSITTCATVHDERAQQLGGVAGHAGVFSTVRDLGIFCSSFLSSQRHPLFMTDWVDQSFIRQTPLSDIRGLGWVIYADNERGRLIGHTGFTGTSLLFCPETSAYCVLLANRIHPSRDNPFIAELRREVAQAVFGQEL